MYVHYKHVTTENGNTNARERSERIYLKRFPVVEQQRNQTSLCP